MILLIGGTSETAPLAAGIAAAGYKVLVSTATDVPLAIGDHPRITRREGRLDEAGMVALAADMGIRAIIDAAHPYAVAAHAAAKKTAERLGIPCLLFRRPEALMPDNDKRNEAVSTDGAAPALDKSRSETFEYRIPDARIGDFSGPPAPAAECPQRRLFEREARVSSLQRSEEAQGRKMSSARRDRDFQRSYSASPVKNSASAESGGSRAMGSPVGFAADHAEAAETAFAFGRPVLVTTGSRNLAPYTEAARRTGIPLAVLVLDIAESLDACRVAGIPEDRIIAGRGPFSVEENLAAIRRFGIGVVVTKDSGRSGGVEAKLAAAHQTNCRVIVIRRPETPACGPIFDSPATLIAALKDVVILK
jgi:precorrin-6x reductase